MKIKYIKNCEGFRKGEEFYEDKFYCFYNEIMRCIISLKICGYYIPNTELDNFILTQ